MEELIRKRNVAVERLKRIHASVKQLSEQEIQAFEIHDRLRKLAEQEETFDRLQAEIEETVPADELCSVLNVRSDYEKLFYATKELVTKLLREEPAASISSDTTVVEPNSELKEAVRVLLETQRTLLSSQAAASTNVEQLAVQLRQQQIQPINTQLPSYNLPVFNGDRKQWASFKDLFISGVDRKNLTSALKLQLLVSHLEGDARSLVSSYSITDANYKQVWDTLVEHFDKPKFTVAALVQEFCDQPATKASNLASLRKLVSTSDEVVRQLCALGPTCETRDPWLNHILLRKLDDGLRSQWAQHIVDNDDPTFDDLLKFLKRKCEALETCATFGGPPSEFVKKEPQKDDRKPFTVKKEIQIFNTVQQQSCPVCADSHRIYECTVFKEYTITERRERVQQAKLCFNCLRPNHCAKSCSSKSVCRNCQQRHHTMLCNDDNSDTTTNYGPGTYDSSSHSPQHSQSSAAFTTAVDMQSAVSCTTNVKNSCSSVIIGLLPTALVRVKRSDGRFQEARVMIDSGSQASLITEHCVTSLGLQRSNANLMVTGIASCSSETTRGVVDLEISSRFSFNPVVNTKAYVLAKFPRIVPNQRLDPERMKCLESLHLADPDFDKARRIDIILGADVFLAVLEDGKIKDGNGLPVAINSTFGWIVAGQVFDASEVNCNTAIVCLSMDMGIDKVLRDVEEVNKPELLSPKEQQAVEFIETTHQQDQTGRFTVHPRFDQNKLGLGESLSPAVERKYNRKWSANDPWKLELVANGAPSSVTVRPEADSEKAQDENWYPAPQSISKESKAGKARSTDGEGNVGDSLIASRTRVASIQWVILPHPAPDWRIENRLKRNTASKLLRRVQAWLYRIKSKSQAKLRGAEKAIGRLKLSEVQEASLQIVRLARQKVFDKHVERLRKCQYKIKDNAKMGRTKNRNKPTRVMTAYRKLARMMAAIPDDSGVDRDGTLKQGKVSYLRRKRKQEIPSTY